ncbi:MAG: 3-hydroxyacyl-CoA dehydrogenase NAD-binding domain-containing protein [Desulfomonilia bacterium]
MEIKKIGVAGFGLMGGGIAQVASQAGYKVIVLEAADEFLKKGFSALEKRLAGAVEKGKMAQADSEAIRDRIQGTTSAADMAGCDFIIEAIIENLDLKCKLFSELDKICPEHTIFASNTSSLTVIEMAMSTKRPDRFVGMHFFNPVPVMKLVEVIRTVQL